MECRLLSDFRLTHKDFTFFAHHKHNRRIYINYTFISVGYLYIYIGKCDYYHASNVFSIDTQRWSNVRLIQTIHAHWISKSQHTTTVFAVYGYYIDVCIVISKWVGFFVTFIIIEQWISMLCDVIRSTKSLLNQWICCRCCCCFFS